MQIGTAFQACCSPTTPDLTGKFQIFRPSPEKLTKSKIKALGFETGRD